MGPHSCLRNPGKFPPTTLPSQVERCWETRRSEPWHRTQAKSFSATLKRVSAFVFFSRADRPCASPGREDYKATGGQNGHLTLTLPCQTSPSTDLICVPFKLGPVVKTLHSQLSIPSGVVAASSPTGFHTDKFASLAKPVTKQRRCCQLLLIRKKRSPGNGLGSRTSPECAYPSLCTLTTELHRNSPHSFWPNATVLRMHLNEASRNPISQSSLQEAFVGPSLSFFSIASQQPENDIIHPMSDNGLLCPTPWGRLMAFFFFSVMPLALFPVPSMDVNPGRYLFQLSLNSAPHACDTQLPKESILREFQMVKTVPFRRNPS